MNIVNNTLGWFRVNQPEDVVTRIISYLVQDGKRLMRLLKW